MGTYADSGRHPTDSKAAIHRLKKRLMPFIRGQWLTMVITIVGVLLLWFACLQNYAFFHTTVEVIVIAVAFAIFLLAGRSQFSH